LAKPESTENPAEDVFAKYAAKPIRKSTQRTYDAYIKVFGEQNLPASPEAILTWLETTDYRASAITTAISALSRWHKEHRHPDPTNDERLKAATLTLKKQRPNPDKKARAITPEEIAQIIKATNEKIAQNELLFDDQLQWVRDSLFVLLGIYLALRVSEICKIQYEHITAYDEGIRIAIPETKTTATVKSIKTFDEGGMVNPAIYALDRWLTMSGIQHGYIFRRIEYGKVVSNPKRPMTLNGFGIPALKRVANAANVNLDGLTTHSLRATGVTVLSLAGVPIAEIARHANHKNLGTTLQYVRYTHEQEIANSVANKISLPTESKPNTTQTTAVSKFLKFLGI